MGHDGREENDGMVEVFYGSPTGLGREPGWRAVHLPPPSKTHAAGRNQLFGSAVGMAGDVNGDGIDDLIAGGCT
jgi:hypothetical protein